MQNKQGLPELLAPAGNPIKMKTAFYYGADAVYLASVKFGLRSAADNFTIKELSESVQWAKQRGKKVYVTLNAFLQRKEQEALPEFVQELNQIAPDGLLISDPAVWDIVRQRSNLNLHVSTQASVRNQYTAKMWQDKGASRIVVARECSIEETGKIKRALDIEVETFIHGAMCSAYSGCCSISNYTAGRDSNRGGCIQSCRFLYTETKQASTLYASLLSSKDLQALPLLPLLLQEQIDSLKIEGRMKSSLYVATVTRAYRQALLKLVNKDTDWYESSLKELATLPHRGYTQGFLSGDLGSDSIYNERVELITEHVMAGTVIEVDKAKGRLFLLTRTKLAKDTSLVVLGFDGCNYTLTCEHMENLNGETLTVAQATQVIQLPLEEESKIEVAMLVRKG